MDRIGEILRPDLADEVITSVRELLGRRHADPRSAIDADLAQLDRRIANLADAVAMGVNLQALVGRVQQTEEARKRLLQQRDQLPASALIRFDSRGLEREAREEAGIVAIARDASRH